MAEAEEKVENENEEVEVTVDDTKPLVNSESDNDPAPSEVVVSEEDPKESEELDDYSKRVQKRIKTLTDKYRTEERDREEAVRFAQTVKQENDKLKERLDKGPVICAEGFLFEIERRGYMASGEFVPMVSLDHPEVLENLHREFQHAGSDIVEAFTYNGHREKMRVIGKEDLLEPLNRSALKIAKKVANLQSSGDKPNLMAGNISNSNIWNDKDKATHAEVEKMFTEMVGWAVDEGADMLIGETFYYAEEAYTALKVMQKTGLPSVITISPMGENIMRDGVGIVDTCKELEQRGGQVVGMNCFRGPPTMFPYIKEIRKALKCHVAALPITYRTTEKNPTFFNKLKNEFSEQTLVESGLFYLDEKKKIYRSEERRVGKECRSRWSPYH